MAPRKLKSSIAMRQEERDTIVNLTRVEESVKSAHHRIDGFENTLKEISASIKNLEAIANGGQGAFKSALFIGGLIGWLVGIGVGVWRVLAGGH